MGKKVMVIGGTYFAGRVFAMLASRNAGFELTFVNRGHYSMGHLPNVTEYKCDRHNIAGLRALPVEEYDAIVDFCAYEPGDVRNLLENLHSKFHQYIYVSTADVYDRSIRTPKDETTPLQTCQSQCNSGEYMFKKMLLEGESREVCEQLGVALTILRPAFIFGPYNYAPRESYFIEKIVKHEPIPVPTDSDSQFQFVYVKDVGNAVIACVNNREKAAGEAYNLCAPEVMTYEKYMDVLRKVSDIPFETTPVTVEEVIRENIALPFPLVASEDELYIGTKIVRDLGLAYTPFEEAMEKTYVAFKGVYDR